MHQVAKPLDFPPERARAGLRAVALSLAIMAVTALFQLVVYLSTNSVALLADLVHNFGDALTALPIGAAFLLRSDRAERGAGFAVVVVILFSACFAGYESIARLIHREAPTDLTALAIAGAIGFVGNYLAGIVRSRAGRTLDSAALVADGHHARADAYVSLGVVLSAAVVAIGFPVADPLIGLAITATILRITWQSWLEVTDRGETSRRGHSHAQGAEQDRSHSH